MNVASSSWRGIQVSSCLSTIKHWRLKGDSPQRVENELSNGRSLIALPISLLNRGLWQNLLRGETINHSSLGFRSLSAVPLCSSSIMGRDKDALSQSGKPLQGKLRGQKKWSCSSFSGRSTGLVGRMSYIGSFGWRLCCPGVATVSPAGLTAR